MEKEAVLTRAQQLQVKEAATRQKLQEFREKLKMTQSGKMMSTQNVSSGSANATVDNTSTNNNTMQDR